MQGYAVVDLPLTRKDRTMSDDLKKGDHVTWKSHGGTAVHEPSALDPA